MIRRLSQILALSIPLALAAPLHAQVAQQDGIAATAPSLDWMQGEWRGEGIFQGRKSSVSLSVRSILDGTGYQFDYRFDVDPMGDKPAMRFSGMALYRKGKSNRWEGRWLDSFGNMHDVSARLSEGSVRTTWGAPSTEVGQTEYRLDQGQLKITDYVLAGSGEFALFHQAILSRP